MERLEIKLTNGKEIIDNLIDSKNIELVTTFSYIKKDETGKYTNNSTYCDFDVIIKRLNEGFRSFFSIIEGVYVYEYLFSKYPQLKTYAMANFLVLTRNYGRRKGESVKNGTKEEQFIGIYSELVIVEALDKLQNKNEALIKADNLVGNDSGIDYVINNLKIDIKTVGRNSPMMDYYSHNFIKSQVDLFDTDAYIAVSYNKKEMKLEISGLITKEEIKTKATLRVAGSKVKNKTGSFILKQDMYDLKDCEIFHRCYTLNDILETSIKLSEEKRLNSLK